jgi:hypothetical protein
VKNNRTPEQYNIQVSGEEKFRKTTEEMAEVL